MGFNLLDNFPKKAAIYGTGSIGGKCYDVVKEAGYEEHVVFFLDSYPEKHNTLFCNKNVYGIDVLRQNTDVSIIISSCYVNEIYGFLQENGIKNEVYCFANIDNFIEDSGILPDIEKVKAIYNLNDQFTNEFIDHFYKQYHNPLIIPYDDFPFPLDIDYWTLPETSLSVFDQLTFVDAGAYTGDTTLYMKKKFSGLSKIYAFEPEFRSREVLEKNIRQENLSGITTVCPYGLGKAEQTVYISGEGLTAKIGDSGDTEIQIMPLDKLDIPVVGRLCIKQDIEGSEFDALLGSKKTIQKYKPELAICIYHKTEDIYALPKLIQDIEPSYRFIIRGGLHPVCYASTERF